MRKLYTAATKAQLSSLYMLFMMSRCGLIQVPAFESKLSSKSADNLKASHGDGINCAHLVVNMCICMTGGALGILSISGIPLPALTGPGPGRSNPNLT